MKLKWQNIEYKKKVSQRISYVKKAKGQRPSKKCISAMKKANRLKKGVPKGPMNEYTKKKIGLVLRDKYLLKIHPNASPFPEGYKIADLTATGNIESRILPNGRKRIFQEFVCSCGIIVWKCKDNLYRYKNKYIACRHKKIN